jgi:hypothetical protein
VNAPEGLGLQPAGSGRACGVNIAVSIQEAPHRIPNWTPARSKVNLIETRFIKQNGNFEKSQDLKGRLEKFKNQ